MAAFSVTTLADSGPGSLRNAITQANHDMGADTISFAPGVTGTIVLTSGELDITDNLTITGPGANKLTVSGNHTSRVFTVGAGEKVSLSGLTIADGDAGIGNGGGLDNLGTVTVRNTVFTRNSAYEGGGLANESGSTASVNGSAFLRNSATYGGGLANAGTATLSRSSFNSNSAGFGGGLANFGTANVSGGTFTRNSAGPGGGLFNDGSASVGGSTFTSNSATNGGGGLENYAAASVSVVGSTFTSNSANFGGGLANIGITVSVSNSTFISNSATDGGGLYNAGSSTVSVSGSTFTSNSAGVNGGGMSNFGVLIQSGNTFTGNHPDNVFPPQLGGPGVVHIAVTSLADSLNPGTLRWAITTADAGDPADSYVIDIVKAGTITLESVLPDLSRNITIKGQGAITSTVERDPTASPFRIFTVDKRETVTISGLTTEGGAVYNGFGGGLDNFGTVTVSNSVFTRNFAYFDGGGLANEKGGTASVSSSTFTGNSVEDYGGGLFNQSGGTASVSGSTFTSNSAGVGGGLNNDGTATVNDSVFTRNSADYGGGLDNSATATVSGSTFTGNSTTGDPRGNGDGGGLDNTGSVSVSDSTFTSNSAIRDGGGLYNEGRRRRRRPLQRRYGECGCGWQHLHQ
jgi:hypothetical protein